MQKFYLINIRSQILCNMRFQKWCWYATEIHKLRCDEGELILYQPHLWLVTLVTGIRTVPASGKLTQVLIATLG